LYRLTTDDQSQRQINALPLAAQPWFAEVRAMLEVAPWGGDPLSDSNPDAPVRTVAFGPHGQGLVTCLILERDRRVDLLDVLWLGD
jgi:hypothetical protein